MKVWLEVLFVFLAIIGVALYVDKVFLEINDSEMAELVAEFERNTSEYLPSPFTLGSGKTIGLSPGILAVNRDAVGTAWGGDWEINQPFMQALSPSIAARAPYQIKTLVLLDCWEGAEVSYSFRCMRPGQTHYASELQITNVVCTASVVDRATQLVVYEQDSWSVEPDYRQLRQACRGQKAYWFPHREIIEWVNSLPRLGTNEINSLPR